ncbi:MAG: class II aldolase, partial [Candidatus Eiseniibacteriota bacterium]
MQNRWSDADARATVERYARQGVNEDLALRVYTSRLLGREPALVLHGGGNTSVKTTVRDITGEDVEVLCVKGSGSDMADIEPAGLPAVRLAPLRALLELDRLSDEDMVNFQRRNLLESSAPNPSVETLLHAFLPHKFIDHTHSNAVLALTDQPDGADLCREVFGARAALVPYIMPGFALAKSCAAVHAQQPEADTLILRQHGIFTMGASAREAYERMIERTSEAEARLARGRKTVAQVKLPQALAGPAAIAPILRGLLAIKGEGDDGLVKRFVLEFRGGPAARAFVDGAELARYSQAGTITPDHAIRTKPWPVILPAPSSGELDDFAVAAAQAIEAFKTRYRAYVERHAGRDGAAKKPLDPAPRVLLVPGMGLFAAGDSARAARVAADIAEAAASVILDAEAIGRFESIAEADLFDIEYWSLE